MAIQSKNEAKLLAILPTELWEQVLENITKAQDYHNISNAPPLFRVLLMPRASEILFSEVVKVLLAQVPPDPVNQNMEDEEDDHNTNNQERQEAAVEERELNQVDCLTMRQVCCRSRRSVDEWLLAQKRDYYIHRNHSKLIRGFQVRLPGFEFEEQFLTWEEHFDSTHLALDVNPFFNRGIRLYVGHGTRLFLEFEEYYVACEQLLQKYGHHLWYCEIYQDFTDSRDEVHFYTQRLPQILGQLSNLRVLYICRDHADGHASVLGGDSDISLPHLEQLKTIWVWKTPRLPFKALLKSNPQPQQVDACGSFHLAKLCLESLPNLTAACFVWVNTHDENFNIFESVCVAGGVNRLSFHVQNMRNVPCERLFHDLESRFYHSVIQLALALPALNENVRICEGLALCNLKTLILTMYKPCVLDFLLPLKETLEKLCIVYDKKFENELKENKSANIELHGFWREPVRSTIWNHFPNLKLVRLFSNSETIFCTRAKWNDAQKNETHRRSKLLPGKIKLKLILVFSLLLIIFVLVFDEIPLN